METWEYEIVPTMQIKAAQIERELNQLGERGWEVVACGNAGEGHHYIYLKRPKK